MVNGEFLFPAVPECFSDKHQINKVRNCSVIFLQVIDKNFVSSILFFHVSKVMIGNLVPKWNLWMCDKNNTSLDWSQILCSSEFVRLSYSYFDLPIGMVIFE